MKSTFHIHPITPNELLQESIELTKRANEWEEYKATIPN